jgi:VIT1/CCC1 family predicted Fe2+/Mn2+ transporter
VNVVLILGFANLLADGFSMGASNYLARRSNVETGEAADRADALRHGTATILGFIGAGLTPLVAYLVPMPDSARLAAAVGLTGVALFAVGIAIARDKAGPFAQWRRDAGRRRARRRCRLRHRGARRGNPVAA